MSWPTDDGTADLQVLIEAARTRRPLSPPLTPRDVLALLTGAFALRPDLPDAEAANLLLHAGAGRALWAKARTLLEGTATTPARRFWNGWMGV